MSELRVKEISPNLRNVYERFRAFSINDPETEHLRPHQIEGVTEFAESVTKIESGEIPNEGMAILHPTGGGKTVEAAAIVRYFVHEHAEIPKEKVLMLVPSKKIQKQVVGTDKEIGELNKYLPDAVVREYSGKNKFTDGDVTVMNYQSLAGAIKRGDIDIINPTLIICDEGHHVIDGAWAESVSSISPGRLLLCLTATPNYSANRSIRRLFPRILVEKTMRQGIEEGILSDLQGFLYKGESKIVVRNTSGEFDDEELFNALAHSKDNYRAINICKGEIQQGRRGVISCVPGGDRAHAKILAELLCSADVTVDGETRKIRAAYVDGDVHEDTLDATFAAYKKGEIDVICYVDMLLEGWDSPETEFTVILRPTSSHVLSEQRLGRIIRQYRNKARKIATVHEIIYEIESDAGDAPVQVTHLDVLKHNRVAQGESYFRGDIKMRPQGIGTTATRQVIFDPKKFALESGLADALKEYDQTPIRDIKISRGQESIPFEWITSHIIALQFEVSRDQVETILHATNVSSRQSTYKDMERTFYSPDAILIVAEELGVKELTDEHLTLTDLVEEFRTMYPHKRISLKLVLESLRKANIEGELVLVNNSRVAKAYTREATGITLHSLQGAPKLANIHKKEYEFKKPEKIGEVINWLASTLQSPENEINMKHQQRLKRAQTNLIVAIQKQKKSHIVGLEELENDISRLKIKPNHQMKNVMEKLGLSFFELVAAASDARTNFLAYGSATK